MSLEDRIVGVNEASVDSSVDQDSVVYSAPVVSMLVAVRLAIVVSLEAIVPGGISVPILLLIAARIIREETAKVPMM